MVTKKVYAEYKRVQTPKDRAHRKNQCGKKKQFRFEAPARSYAHKLSAELSEELETYECPWCGFYHVGHKESEKQRGSNRFR